MQCSSASPCVGGETLLGMDDCQKSLLVCPPCWLHWAISLCSDPPKPGIEHRGRWSRPTWQCVTGAVRACCYHAATEACTSQQKRDWVLSECEHSTNLPGTNTSALGLGSHIYPPQQKDRVTGVTGGSSPVAVARKGRFISHCPCNDRVRLPFTLFFF